MNKIYFLVLVFLTFGCTHNLVEYNDAMALQSMIDDISIENIKLTRQIYIQISTIKQIYHERSIAELKSEEYVTARTIQDQSRLLNEFSKQWIDEMVLKTGGYMESQSLPIYWEKKVRPGLIIPEMNDKLEDFRPSINNQNKNILIAILEVQNWLYFSLQSLLNSSKDLKSRVLTDHKHEMSNIILVDLIMNNFQSESGLRLWAGEVLHVDSFLLNQNIQLSNNGVLKFSNVEWRNLKIDSVKIFLNDTIDIFYLNQD